MPYSVIVFFVILLGLSGCSSKTNTIQQSQRQALSSPESIELYTQRLYPSKALLEKAFKLKTLRTKMSRTELFSGNETTTSFDLSNPLIFEYKFDKKYQVFQADIHTFLPLVDDTMMGHEIFAKVRSLDIIYDDRKKASLKLRQNQETMHAFREEASSSLVFNIKSFYTDENLLSDRKFSVVSQDINVTFSLFDVSYKKAIVKEVLTLREDEEKNEALLHAISRVDLSYYYKLRKERKSYILPKHSMLNMPDDADIEYADKNYKQFFKNGKYRTETGRYKIVFAEDLMKFKNGDIKIKNRHTIDEKYSKQKIKKTTDIPDHDGFIDFSEGVE